MTVPQATIGDESGRAANHCPSHQHVPTGGSRHVTPTVHDDHMTWWNILDRLPLQRVPAAVRIRGVYVLPSGNEPHRVRLAVEAVDGVAQQFELYQRRLPEPSAI